MPYRASRRKHRRVGLWPATLAFTAIFLSITALPAQETKEFVLAAGRSGAVQIIDPSTLQTVATLHVDLPPSSVGLNSVATSPDGELLYLWGPTPSRPNICCYLYAVNMTTFQATTAAEIPGSSSYRKWVPTPGVIHDAATLIGPRLMPAYSEFEANSIMRLSPEHDALAALRTFGGPTIAMFDLRRGTAVQMTPPGLPPENSKGNWALTGAWSGEQLYACVSRPDDAGWVWTVRPDAQEMGQGVPLAQFGEMPGCATRFPVYKMMVAASGNLYIYEPFGSKSDRTGACGDQVPGGAWILDPVTGKLKAQIAPAYHFNRLVATRSGADLYGIDPGHGNWSGPVQLVRIDARDGTVSAVRTLEPDVWAIAAAPLRTPRGSDVHITLPR